MDRLVFLSLTFLAYSLPFLTYSSSLPYFPLSPFLPTFLARNSTGGAMWMWM